MSFDLKLDVLMNKHKKEDGTFNFEAAQEDMQTQLNGFEAKNKPDLDKIKLDAADEAKKSVFGEMKIDGVTDITSFNEYHTKITSDDQAKALTDANKAHGLVVKEWETKFNELNGKHNTLSNKVLITDNGFNPKYSNAIIAEMKTRLVDDKKQEDVIKEISEGFPEWKLVESKGGRTPKGGNRFSANKKGEEKTEKRWNAFNR